MFALKSYHRYFAKIFVNVITELLAGNTQYILLGLTTFAYIAAWHTV